MTMMMKMLAAGTGIAAMAAAAPAAAQYGYGYNVNPYAYNVTQMATSRCAAAVQNRLSARRGTTGIIGALLGARTSAGGRVLAFTRVDTRRNTVRVRGLASSGTAYGYSPYGVGAYGALGYSYRPDLTFKCDVDYRGRVVDVDINRRR